MSLEQSKEIHINDLPPSPPRWRSFLPKWLSGLIWVDQARHFNAFLSYSWGGDLEIAPVIQSVLQGFLCPWYKMRALNIFRDLSSLPVNNSLANSLRDRLDRSHHLIVLAGSRASISQGMQFEADYWCSRPRKGQIIIVVTEEMNPTWAYVQANALPPALKSYLITEPLWISIAHRRGAILSNSTSPALRGQMIEDLKQLFLCLYPNHDWGTLRGQERHQRRVALVLLWTFVTSMTVVASFACWQYIKANRAMTQAVRSQKEAKRAEEQATENAWQAKRNADEAAANAQKAIVNASYSRARQLAAEADLLRQDATNPVSASTKKALDATRLLSSSETVSSLYQSVILVPEMTSVIGKTAIGNTSNPADRITALAISADSEYFAVARLNHKVCIYNRQTLSAPIRTCESIENVRQLSFTPNDELQVLGLTGEITVIPVNPADQVKHLQNVLARNDFREVVSEQNQACLKLIGASQCAWKTSEASLRAWFSSDGTRAAVENVRGMTIIAIPENTGAMQIPLADPPLDFQMSGQGNYVAIGSPSNPGTNDTSFRVYDVETGKEVFQARGKSVIQKVGFSYDGNLIAALSVDGALRIFDIRSAQELARFEVQATAFAFAGDSNRILVASKQDGTAFYKLHTKRVVPVQVKQSFGRQGVVNAAALSQNGSLIVGDSAMNATLFTGEKMNLVGVHRFSDVVSAVDASTGGGPVAAITYDGTVSLLDASTGHEIWRYSQGSPINSPQVTLSQDGRWIASSSMLSRKVAVYSTGTAHRNVSFTVVEFPIRIKLSPDGRQLAVIGSDRSVSLYRRGVSAPVWRRFLENGSVIAFSPDSSRLAVGTAEGKLIMHSVNTGTTLVTSDEDRSISALAFASDGSVLAVGSSDRYVNVRRSDDLQSVFRAVMPDVVLAVRFYDGNRGLRVFSRGSLMSIRWQLSDLQRDARTLLSRFRSVSER